MSIASEITRLSNNVSDSLDAVAAKGVTVPSGSNSDNLPSLISQISTGVDLSCIADEYSSSSTYNVGEYAFYDGDLYRCITAINPGENWTAAHWTHVALGADVYELANKVKAFESKFRLISEITITADTPKRLLVNTDTNNSPFSLSEAVIYFNTMVASASGSACVSVNIGTGYVQATDPYIFAPNAYYSSARSSIVNLSIRGGRFFGTTSNDDLVNAYTQTNMRTVKNAMGLIACDSIQEIGIYSPNAYYFTAGTITIYGR